MAGTPPQSNRRTTRYTKKDKINYTSIWDRWQNDETYWESQIAIGWSGAWVTYLDHIAQIDISLEAPQEQISRYHNLFYLRCVDEGRQASPLATRPGYLEAKTALVEMQRQSRQDLGIPFVPKSERRCLNDQINLSLRVYLEWLSTNGQSTSQKNANRQPHLPLLSGLQHPGGTHTRGLRNGKDGINTAGRMTSGQINGDRQHRLVFKMKSILASVNWGHGFKKTSQKLLSTRTKRLDRHPDFFFLVAFLVLSDATH